jgi:hypothetical protein
MKHRSLLPVLAGAILGLALGTPKTAAALDALDIEIAAKAGGATNPSSTSGAPNALGFGLGARAGVSFLDIYGGATFRYYFGGGADGTTPGVGTQHLSYTSLLFGIEGGYSIGNRVIKVRPQIGLGDCIVTTSLTGQGSFPSSSVYVEPSIQGLVYFGTVLVGADAGLLLIPNLNNWQPAFTLNGQVGVKF